MIVAMSLDFSQSAPSMMENADTLLYKTKPKHVHLSRYSQSADGEFTTVFCVRPILERSKAAICYVRQEQNREFLNSVAVLRLSDDVGWSVIGGLL